MVTIAAAARIRSPDSADTSLDWQQAMVA